MEMTYPTMGIDANACWKTLGKVMNTSDGPLSGLTPTENAAGNIMRPARMAIMVSMMDICTADFSKLVSRPKYEAYVQRHAVPRLSEKNDCPRAAKMTSDVIFEKSGLKRNSTPVIAPGSMHEGMTSIINMTKSVGMSSLEIRSIPFFTPLIITR